jgi:hypothetical protein
MQVHVKLREEVAHRRHSKQEGEEAGEDDGVTGWKETAEFLADA